MCEKYRKDVGQMTKPEKAEILKYKNELKETMSGSNTFSEKLESLAEIEQDCVDNTPKTFNPLPDTRNLEVKAAENLACAAERAW